VIRNAVIHVAGEQPILADLFDTPANTDVGLLCTNVRTVDGKRPVFVDAKDSVFYVPYLHIRFVEIMAGAGAEGLPAIDGPAGRGAEEPAVSEIEAELELDEDFLRRIRDV
jgi:hypothetical protein